MDDEEPHRFVNCYRCDICGHSWTDTYSCQVDDQCSKCGRKAISPYVSYDIEDEDKLEEYTVRLGASARVYAEETVWAIDGATARKAAAKIDPSDYEFTYDPSDGIEGDEDATIADQVDDAVVELRDDGEPYSWMAIQIVKDLAKLASESDSIRALEADNLILRAVAACKKENQPAGATASIGGPVTMVDVHAIQAGREKYLEPPVASGRDEYGDPIAVTKTYAHLPERCPSNHWNGGDDICEDCGEDLNPPTVATDAVDKCKLIEEAIRKHDALNSAFEHMQKKASMTEEERARYNLEEDRKILEELKAAGVTMEVL